MADEDIVVSIDENDQTQTTGGNEAAEDLKAQFAEIQSKEQASRERAEAADRRANQAIQEANRARESERSVRSEIADRELDTIVSGIAAAQAEADAAAKDFEAAAETGDFKKQADAQRRIARAEARVGRLDEAKADIEIRRAETGRHRPDAGRERGGEVRTEQRQSAGDPVEAFIASRDSATQAWLRAHPDETRALILDPNSTRARKLNAAHNDAMAEGYSEGSAKYFEHIESFIGLAKKEQTNGSGERQRRSSPSAAPVSGNGSMGGGRGQVNVTLTKGEKDAAEDGTHVWGRHDLAAGRIKDASQIGQPIGTREMARRKLHLEKEGAYRNFLVEQ